MSRACSLIAKVARDFLVPDASGRRQLRPEGRRALAVSTQIATQLGVLAPAIDEALRLCIMLEREQSFEAAKAIEEAIAGVDSVRRLLGVRGDASLVPHLERRRLRLLGKPRTHAHFAVRDMLAQAPRRTRRLS